MLFFGRSKENIVSEEDRERANRYVERAERDITGCNCGGFALGTFDWVNANSINDEDFIDDSDEEVTKNLARQLIRIFKGVRIISSESQLHNDEDLVYFRASMGEDGVEFHFVRFFGRYLTYNKNGELHTEQLQVDDANGYWTWCEGLEEQDYTVLLAVLKNGASYREKEWVYVFNRYKY